MNTATKRSKYTSAAGTSDAKFDLQLEVHRFNGDGDEDLVCRIPFTDYIDAKHLSKNPDVSK